MSEKEFMEKVEEIKKLQAELDYRTEVENQAVKLIAECRFEEAVNLLKAI